MRGRDDPRTSRPFTPAGFLHPSMACTSMLELRGQDARQDCRRKSLLAGMGRAGLRNEVILELALGQCCSQPTTPLRAQAPTTDRHDSYVQRRSCTREHHMSLRANSKRLGTITTRQPFGERVLKVVNDLSAREVIWNVVRIAKADAKTA